MAKRKDIEKLWLRNALDFAALRDVQSERARTEDSHAPAAAVLHAVAADHQGANPALLRLKALTETLPTPSVVAPVDPARPNWTPLGPLAIPNGQTYGGARVLISGRVTAIAPDSTNASRIFIGTSRGGTWRTDDAGVTWSPLGDNQPSLAIGALAAAESNPNILYAGTGEGNVQYYSTVYPTSSAPGVYLGIGVLRSIDGGATWTHHAAALLANHSFYRIAVNRTDPDRAFAATSRGLCRTTDGAAWTELAGGGLPAISSTVIACTDVFIDRGDTSGNTVYAAFFNGGIYKSTNALAANPTFTQLTTGLPVVGMTGRISLHQSASSPARKYALIANNADSFLGLYRTTSATGTSWELCTNSAMIEVYGAFTSDVKVDPTTPNIVYISGVELYKCVRSTATGAWTVTNIGSAIHPDSHCFGFHPTNNQVIYSGNDGGFFVSRDGGVTWDDNPNEGLCLLQFEAIDHHGSSDALVQGGTQDNGTQRSRNSPVFYHSADGDGGYCAVSKVNGNNVMHAYYSNSPERSTTGGKFGAYAGVSAGIDGSGLFYPPAAISPTSERMAWATDVINFDDSMGTGGWPGSGIALPGLTGKVSSISFTSNTLVYCATTTGKVYRLEFSSGVWTVRAIHATPLPTGQWIWDVQSVPGNDNAVIVAFSGFGLAQHIWRGAVPATGAATWGAASGGLPDVPMYALAPKTATEWYVGSDIGVFRTTDAGATWGNFSQGLPNTAIYDLRQRPSSRLLRAATHGRGLWEIDTGGGSHSTVDIFVRDNIMDIGEPSSGAPVPAAWEDPTRHIALNDTCWWWHCADIKADAPPTFQLQPSEANYLNFETKLIHEDPEKGNLNRVYVQIHNRGPLPAQNVAVKIMVAGASAGLPNLPSNFWSSWPNSVGDANWTAVGVPQTISQLSPLRPEVLRWDWIPPISADAHTCMLVVIDSPSDPIPTSTKAIFNIAQLVTADNRVGLRNLHLVNLIPSIIWPLPLHLHASWPGERSYLLRIPRLTVPQPNIGFLLSQRLSSSIGDALPNGIVAAPLATRDLDAIKKRWLVVEARSEESWNRFLHTFDVRRQISVSPHSKEAELPLAFQ